MKRHLTYADVCEFIATALAIGALLFCLLVLR